MLTTVKEPLAPRVAESLAATEAREAALRAQVQSYALDEYLGDAEVTKKREAAERELATASADVVRLRHAKQQAEARDQRTEAETLRARQEHQLGVMSTRATRRLELMTAIVEHLKAATGAYQEFLAETDLMLAAIPEQTTAPDGVIDERPDMLLAGAMFKLADGRRGLPGAKPPTIADHDNPGAAEDPVEVIKRNNAWRSATAKRQIGIVAEPVDAAA